MSLRDSTPIVARTLRTTHDHALMRTGYESPLVFGCPACDLIAAEPFRPAPLPDGPMDPGPFQP